MVVEDSREGGRIPGALPLQLVITIKSGWRYDQKLRVFLFQAGKKFDPYSKLPPRTRIVYLTPDIARKPPDSQTSEERNLARYMFVIFPKGTDMAKQQAIVESWPCIDHVEPNPQVSLPSG